MKERNQEKKQKPFSAYFFELVQNFGGPYGHNMNISSYFGSHYLKRQQGNKKRKNANAETIMNI